MQSTTTDVTFPKTNKLSRELLKWIQSLDLAYSIKNVKRDFCNGFLVAEIMSRYFDKEISMHSYDNGSSLKTKKDNWNQLLKFFSKIPGLEDVTTKSVIDAIVYAENGAAVCFLNSLYSKLTNRSVTTTLTAEESTIPPYAQNTGSSLVKSEMKRPETLNLRDDKATSDKMQHVIDEHNYNKEYLSPPPPSSSIRRGVTSTVMDDDDDDDDEDDNSAVLPTVKTVTVRSLNESNLAKLRSSRNRNNNNNQESAAKQQSSSPPTSLITNDEDNLIALLDEECCCNEGGSDFVSIMTNQNEDFENTETRLGEIHDFISANQNAQRLLKVPREFYKFSSLLLKYILRTSGAEATAIICTVPQLIDDKVLTSCYFNDYLIRHVSTGLLQRSSSSQDAMASIVLAYSNNDACDLMDIIKALRTINSGDDISPFITIVSSLLRNKNKEIIMDDSLLDLYQYYCTIGIETISDPKVRENALSMLPILLHYDSNFVYNYIPLLCKFDNSITPGIKHALIAISNAVLLHRSEDEEDDEDVIESCIDLLLNQLENTNISVREHGVRVLAEHSREFPDLLSPMINVLRNTMGVLEEVSELWDAESTVSAITNNIMSEEDHFDKNLMRILHKAIVTCEEKEEDVIASEVYDDIKHVLLQRLKIKSTECSLVLSLVPFQKLRGSEFEQTVVDIITSSDCSNSSEENVLYDLFKGFLQGQDKEEATDFLKKVAKDSTLLTSLL